MAEAEIVEEVSIDTTSNEDGISPGGAAEDDDFQWNELYISEMRDGLEHIIDYEAGGHHPVHLDDKLGPDDRYQVVHKLGSGGFGTVWLVRDLKSPDYKYAALKVMMAEATRDSCPELHTLELKQLAIEKEVGGNSICLAQDHFQIHGPNGVHTCVVYPALGPTIAWYLKSPTDPGAILRKLALDVAQAMAALHRLGFCHGDLTFKNILLKLSSLDGLSEEQLFQAFGEPKRVPVTKRDGSAPTEPSAPQYLVRAIDFNNPNATPFIMQEACVIDFGESYRISAPPEDLGIPFYYRPPELHLNKTVGIGCDLWALACTLFNIRVGRRLFDTFDDDMDEFLYSVVLVLGPFPEPWWSEWKLRQETFEDKPDPFGRAVRTARIEEEATRPGSRPDDRSIRECLAYGMQYISDDWGVTPQDHDISAEEADLFADLLGQLLRYKPDERLSADKVVQHPWFRFGLESASDGEPVAG